VTLRNCEFNALFCFLYQMWFSLEGGRHSAERAMKTLHTKLLELCTAIN